MDTVASTLSRSRRFHRVPFTLGILTMLLLPAVQASEGLCNKVTAPSTQALLSTVAHPPASKPQAIPIVHTEGTLPHQGIYDTSNAARRDFSYMRDLALAWQRTQDAALLSRLTVYLDDWMKTYQLSFNPIDETSFDGLIDAYRLTHSALPEATRERTRTFLHAMATGYLQKMDENRSSAKKSWINNWQSHRVKLVTMSAVALDDAALLAKAKAEFIRQLDANIHADGEVMDFTERDALHYVVYSLEPLLRAAMAAQLQGENWIDLKGRHGQSLRTALEWLKPYADGEKTHEEFANTKVRFDIERRNAGVKGFDGQWHPSNAANVYWSASVLDLRYLETARRLNKTPARWLWAMMPCQ